jgi:hypothetical protein
MVARIAHRKRNIGTRIHQDAIRVAIEVTPGVRTISNNLSIKHVLSAQ